MWMKVSSDKKVTITAAAFLLFSGWWMALQYPIVNRDLLNQLFGGLYGIVALLGAIWGIYIHRKWGGLKSLIGKAIFMFSLGLFAQEFGQLVYFYYIFYRQIEIPYPSIGDIGYFGSIPLYIYGTLLLAKAAGVKVSLQSFKNKLQAILIPSVMLGYSYFVFLQGYKFDWSAPLTVFLDFGYPLGQAIYVSLAILTLFLTRGVLGGIMKHRVLFVLFALLMQYLADYTFLYQASQETWVAGGINDYMYLVSYFIMALALLQFRVSHIKAKLS